MLGKRTSKRNLILFTDSYKPSHFLQYPPNTEAVYSYFEPRIGARWQDTVFFGLQYFLKEYLSGVVVTKNDTMEAMHFLEAHLGNKSFNLGGWAHIIGVHGGRLPLSIRAVPEGTPVSEGNVLMTVENTDPRCYWLTNYVETLLVETWYPSTVATQSREMKRILKGYLDKTGDPGLIDFKLHDFGFRGSTSPESAGLGGAAHLVNFKGTDTIPGLLVAKDYYSEPMAGFSIPAAEHSTITSWGRDNEAFAYGNMLDRFPTGLVAVVSDSYDIENACENIWGTLLRERVLTREGTLVVRPDSGHPPTMVLKVLEILGAKLGYAMNEKGFKVLDPHVRVIQGDGVDLEMMTEVLAAMKASGWSADNIAFGCGGALLQKLNRDTQRFAFKASAIKVSGRWRNVFKQPKSDPSKNSKQGRLKLLKTPWGGWMTHQDGWTDDLPGAEDQLVEVFRDGHVLVEHTFNEIRNRASV